MSEDDDGKGKAPATTVQAKVQHPCPFCGKDKETGFPISMFDTEDLLKAHLEDAHLDQMAQSKMEKMVPEYIQALNKGLNEDFTSWTLITVTPPLIRVQSSILKSNSLEEMLCVEGILQMASDNKAILSGRDRPRG